MTLEEKVDYLEKIVLEDCPFSKMALSCNLGIEEKENVLNIFEKYSKMCLEGASFDYSDFEGDFRKIGIDYQGLKSIILIIGDARRYLEVIVQFLKSCKENNYLSCEYERLYDELCSKK